MQITLLPPLLPTDGVTSVPTASVVFTPGARIEATVLSGGLEGRTSLSLSGREVSTGGTLPYPPGTTLALEVVRGGDTPVLRLVAAEVAAEPPVSAVTYGLAAAVLAARDGSDVRAAALAVARWMPALVASGLLSAAQGECDAARRSRPCPCSWNQRARRKGHGPLRQRRGRSRTASPMAASCSSGAWPMSFARLVPRRMWPRPATSGRVLLSWRTCCRTRRWGSRVRATR